MQVQVSKISDAHNERLTKLYKLVLSGLCLALGLTLPMLVGEIPQLGSMLLPMHLPVLLAGFLCGWPYGLAVGVVVPFLGSLLFGMPPLFPTAVSMAFELAAYGFFSGLLFSKSAKKLSSLYLCLILSMLLGRAVWGVVSLVLYGAAGKGFTWAMFAAGAFLNALPGIALQLVLAAPLYPLLKKAGRAM